MILNLKEKSCFTCNKGFNFKLDKDIMEIVGVCVGQCPDSVGTERFRIYGPVIGTDLCVDYKPNIYLPELREVLV